MLALKSFSILHLGIGGTCLVSPDSTESGEATAARTSSVPPRADAPLAFSNIRLGFLSSPRDPFVYRSPSILQLNPLNPARAAVPSAPACLVPARPQGCGSDVAEPATAASDASRNATASSPARYVSSETRSPNATSPTGPHAFSNPSPRTPPCCLANA